MDNQQKEVQNGPSGIETRRAHLQRTISYYLKELDDGRLPRDQNGVLSVLSVGCMFGYEAKPVLDIFPNAHYKGIDIKEELIKGAREVNKALPSEAVNFAVEDARIIDEDEREKYGLVMLRHPQVKGAQIRKDEENTPEVWRHIIASSIAKVVTGGYIFSTVHDQEEADLVRRHLLDNNVEVTLVQENLASDPDQKGLIFPDAVIIIGHKKAGKESLLSVK